jgi:hypothetical protein
LGNSTVYIGTTAVALNRASGSISLTGTNIDGSAGSASTASTASTATNVTVTDNTSSSATWYPTFLSTTTGNLPITVSSTKLQYVPSSGVLTATGFSGSGASLTGTAASLTAGKVQYALTAGTNITFSSGTTYDGSAAITINATGGGGGGMVYPGAGIPNSTGSAWGTSYTTTGSGTVVALATSPTFVTPLLGTPTSGNLANCTGYTYANLAGTVPTWNQNTTGTAAALTNGRTIAITGDLTYTSPSFDGSSNVTAAGTLATVNTNVGSFTNATLTVNGKGLITAASSGTAPVTSVTATAPVASTGGTTPVISMPAATTSVSGYLTSTDWTTFNNKGSGTVTSVSGTGTVNGISLSGTVTASGNLTLGGTLDLSSPPAIGGTTASTGRFTTVTSTIATGTEPFTVASTTPVTNLSIGGNAATATNVAYSGLTGTVPTWNQNTTGSAATLTTARGIYGNNFDGSAALTQIIASTYGGTGNGFTKFSGATTAEKTYTLPDATTTILTTNSAVTIGQGGTGQSGKTAAFDALSPTTTKGDLIVNNGTNNIRIPVGADTYVLTADSTQASGLTWAAGGSGGGLTQAQALKLVSLRL